MVTGHTHPAQSYSGQAGEVSWGESKGKGTGWGEGSQGHRGIFSLWRGSLSPRESSGDRGRGRGPLDH